MTLLLLGAYLASVLLVGLLSRRRAGRDEVSFFLADRSLSTFWGFVGLASLTTGGSTTIALAAFVYAHGISGMWLDLAGVIGLALLGLLLAGRVRREGAVTLPEIVGRHYGPGARRAAAVLVLLSEIVWFALLTEGTQIVLTAAFGLTPTVAILLSTAVFVAYTALGGQFAVVRTDLIQYGLMLDRDPRHRARLRARAIARDRDAARRRLELPDLSDALRGGRGGLLLLVGLPHLVGSDVYLKLLSCRDERTARRSALLAAGSKLLFGAAVAAIALAARAALPSMPPRKCSSGRCSPSSRRPWRRSCWSLSVATMQTSADVVLLSAAAVTARDIAPPLLGRPLPLSALPRAAALLRDARARRGARDAAGRARDAQARLLPLRSGSDPSDAGRSARPPRRGTAGERSRR